MRTLSAELTSAQRAVANTPHLEIKLTRRNMATILTYKTDDATNRVLRIRTAEGFFGGSLFEISAPNGDIVPIAAQILLRNSDNEFTGKDLRGYKTEIKWGFESYWDGSSTVSISGTKTSQGEPYWVFAQKEHSLEGELITELQCISAWYYLSLEKIMGTSLGKTYTAQGKTIRGLLFEVLTDDADKVFTFDSSGASFADITSAVIDPDSTSAIPVDTGDILYIGVTDTDIAEIDRLTIYGSTDGVYAGTSVWEYWNGAAWTALTNTDETSRLTDFDVGVADSVPKVMFFDLPTDMASTVINGSTLRWVRLRFTGAETTKPVINLMGVHRFWGLSNTAIDAIEDDSDVQPDFETSFETSRLEVLRILLDQTKSKFIMQENFFKMALFDETPSSTDYDYSIAGAHTVFADARERVALIPNQIIVTNIQNNGPANRTQVTGGSTDTAEQAEWGPIIEFENATEVKTVTLANLRGLVRIERYQAQRYQGEFSAPMNIGLEPWDWVGVTDSRLSITTTGRVGRVLREYNQAEGILRDVVTLGTPKWTASLSLNKFLNEAKLGSNVGSSPDLPEIITSESLFTQASRRTNVLEGHIAPEIARINRVPVPAARFQGFDQGFDIDAGPFDLGIPYSREGYQPRKYNLNPEAYGFRAKELTVDVLAFRDFEQTGAKRKNLLVYQDSAFGGLVIDTQDIGTTPGLLFKQTSVAHGITSKLPTNVWGMLDRIGGTRGGVELVGATELRVALRLQGYATLEVTTVSRSADSVISFNAAVKTGTTSTGLAATSLTYSFENGIFATNFIRADGAFLWMEPQGDKYVGLVAPASVNTNVIYALPPADGSSGDHLRTDGSGILTWETPTVVANTGWTDDGDDVRLTDSANDVGIGTASPDSRLHVHESSAGTVVAANNAVLTLEDNSLCWLSFLSPTNAGIAFGDVADNDIGRIYYTHADNTLRIDVNAQEVFVISDSIVQINSVDVGIGIAAPDSKLHVEAGSAGTVTAIAGTTVTIEDNGDAALTFLSTALLAGGFTFQDPDDADAAQLFFDHANDWYDFNIAASVKIRLTTTQLSIVGVDIDGEGNTIFDFREATSDPTLASMQNAEVVTGDVGSGTTDGRIWVESRGRVYRFDSFTSYN